MVQQVDIQHPLRMVSEKSGTWQIEPQPEWKWDVSQIQTVVTRLGTLRSVRQEPERVDLHRH